MEDRPQDVGKHPGATHEDYSRHHQAAGSSNRQFGLVMSAALLVIGLWPVLRGNPVRLNPLAAGAVFLLLALTWPSGLGPLNKIWTAFGLALGRVTTPVAMGILFYLVFTPIATIFRLSGRDALRLRWNRQDGSYWILRDPPGPRAETMIRQF
jgi:hypothetical protein